MHANIKKEILIIFDNLVHDFKLFSVTVYAIHTVVMLIYKHIYVVIYGEYNKTSI